MWGILTIGERSVEPGVLWMATHELGLLRIDVQSRDFVDYSPELDRLDGMNFLLFEDKNHNLWASGEVGVYKINPAPAYQRYYTYQGELPEHLDRSIMSVNGNGIGSLKDIYKDKQGVLWIPYNDLSVDRLYPEKSVVVHDPDFLPEPIRRAGFTDLWMNKEGDWWIANLERELVHYDPASDETSRYPFFSTGESMVYNIDAMRIEGDSQDRSWVFQTRDTLTLFDRQTGSFEAYPIRDGELEYKIQTIFHEDERGRFLMHLYRYSDRVGEVHGIGRFDPASRIIDYYRDIIWPMAALEDSAGRIWMGNLSDGVVRIDPVNNTSERITVEEGLPVNSINDLFKDQRENIIILSGSSWFRYDMEREVLRPIPLLPEATRGNYLGRDQDGDLYFRDKDGITAISPHLLAYDSIPPPVVFTDFRIDNKPVPIGSDSPLKTHISIADELALTYDQRNFTLEFAALDFDGSEDYRYAYQLVKYDENWIESANRRTAAYTNMNPGEYIFRVKAAGSDGTWSSEASIRVIILKPWWQTLWFRFLSFAIVLYVILTVFRLRMRRMHAHRLALEEQVADRTAELEIANERLLLHEQQLEEQNALLEAGKTQLQEQARHLAELSQVKNRFFANISHEFRTPLTLILGPLQDAIDGRYEPVGRRLFNQLNIMQRNGLRLMELIEQLLDLSRLDHGLLTLRARRLDIVAFLRQLVYAFSARAEREQIALQFSATEPACFVYFEPDKMEKVLANLLTNAFRFTPSQGKIRVDIAHAEQGSDVVITVRDTGQGIPMEVQSRVFDRFYQIGPSEGPHKGMGIGLSLARELIELHGGTIDLESMPGFGTTFIIRLPSGRAHLRNDQILEVDETLTADWREDLPEKTRSVSVAHGSDIDVETANPLEDTPRVLVVDDNPDIRAYLREHLIEHYQVTEAPDGARGLEQARTDPPDVVIADVMMPQMDGFMLCEALKADPELKHIPVLFLTAKADVESKLEGLSDGAEDYLTKPFNATELLLRVGRLVEVRHTLRERYRQEVVLKPNELVVSPAEAVFMNQVRSVIDQHMNDANFDVGWLAEEVGLSIRQLQRRLQEIAHLSAGRFIRDMRLERAAQLLEDEAASVSEIAYSVGFKNAQHFSRLFRKTYGVPPSEYSVNKGSSEE